MLSQVRLWGPSWSKGRTAGHIFGREPSNDYLIKILFLLSKWFQTRFLWEFPIGSYVKSSSAVAAILVGGLKCWTQFWKGTTQGSFQHGCGGHLGRRSEMSDTVLEGDHPRIISAKFGWNWLSSFRGDFFLISSPLYSTFSLAAILDGSRDHRTQFSRGAT